jgi:hypothetical protein
MSQGLTREDIHPGIIGLSVETEFGDKTTFEASFSAGDFYDFDNAIISGKIVYYTSNKPFEGL